LTLCCILLLLCCRARQQQRRLWLHLACPWEPAWRAKAPHQALTTPLAPITQPTAAAVAPMAPHLLAHLLPPQQQQQPRSVLVGSMAAVAAMAAHRQPLAAAMPAWQLSPWPCTACSGLSRPASWRELPGSQHRAAAAAAAQCQRMGVQGGQWRAALLLVAVQDKAGRSGSSQVVSASILHDVHCAVPCGDYRQGHGADCIGCWCRPPVWGVGLACCFGSSKQSLCLLAHEGTLTDSFAAWRCTVTVVTNLRCTLDWIHSCVLRGNCSFV
jgi:hypothetical protein